MDSGGGACVCIIISCDQQNNKMIIIKMVLNIAPPFSKPLAKKVGRPKPARPPYYSLHYNYNTPTGLNFSAVYIV